MQGLARQLNLSETTFVTPAVGEETATVRIFTPSYEMPFAGHPTLGTAAVVGDLAGGRTDVVLSMPAGLIPVHADGAAWTLRANAPTTAPSAPSRPTSRAWSGWAPRRWPTRPSGWTPAPCSCCCPCARRRTCAPRPPTRCCCGEFATRPDQQALVYLWAPREDGDLEARLFFTQDGAVIEDPATGSACANLGGWFQARGERGIRRRIHQGAAVHRPSLLELEVDDDGAILVSGTVSEVARGVYRL